MFGIVRAVGAVIIAAGVAVGALSLIPESAHAVRLEAPDRDVRHVRVSYVEPVGRVGLFVELNNGAAYRLKPCRQEDGRHCYWDADDMGNGEGRSFVYVGGRRLFSPMVRNAR